MVQNKSLRNADDPRPRAKKANRQLSCRASPGNPMPSATNAGPTGSGSSSPATTHKAPMATPTTRAVPVAADVARRQRLIRSPLNRTRSGSVARPRAALMTTV